MVEIVEIEVWANQYATKAKYGNIAIETSMTGLVDDWSTCKASHTVIWSINPHVVRCDEHQYAKYVRLLFPTGSNLYLAEVKVKGM